MNIIYFVGEYVSSLQFYSRKINRDLGCKLFKITFQLRQPKCHFNLPRKDMYSGGILQLSTPAVCLV